MKVYGVKQLINYVLLFILTSKLLSIRHYILVTKKKLPEDLNFSFMKVFLYVVDKCTGLFGSTMFSSLDVITWHR